MPDIIDSVQLDDPGSALVDLFELELPSSTLYFYPGLKDGTDPVWFPTPDGVSKNEYIAIPMEFEGLEITSEGVQSRPTLTIANIAAHIGSAADTTLYDELTTVGELKNEYFIGKKLTRRRTLAEHLLESADSPVTPEEMPSVVYIIDRVASENNVVVEFELSSPLDVEGVQIPNRVVVGKYCSWEYQGYYANSRGGCPWRIGNTKRHPDGAGGVNQAVYYFDYLDRPIVLAFVLFITWTGNANKDDLIEYAGTQWRCEEDGTTEAPSKTSPKWQHVVIGQVYDNGAKTAVDPTNFDNAYEHNGKIYIPIRDVPANTPPSEEDAYYWKRIDLCSKTVSGCKVRFQGKPIDPATSGTNVVPSADLNTAAPLYFGGFPGTTKFR